MLLEPLPVVPSVAIFGMGHVGHELARILAARGLCDEAATTFRQAIAQVPEHRKSERADIEAAASTIAGCSRTAHSGPPPSMN